MNSSRSRWVSAVGAVLVGGGLVTAGYGGSGVMPAGAAVPASNPGNPFSEILAKLDQILAALTSGAGGGNHTLRWDQALPAAQRFVVLAAFPDAAVLDQNTGLVWEQSPATTTAPLWESATSNCINKNVGGQKRWRLPSIPELASLIDPTVAAPGPTLPASHPFFGVQSASYWSATTIAVNPSNAWVVNFFNGGVGFGSMAGNGFHAWCVRGGMNADAY